MVMTQFGVEHTVGLGSIVDHGACGPISFTIPNGNFPSSGTSIAIAYYPTVYRTLFPVYWFGVMGSSGDTFASTEDRGLGYGVFVDESMPPDRLLVALVDMVIDGIGVRDAV